ncbi:hybrid sensor histidine kinase/response regulator [Aromatoleum toluclasticum]|uniref:hybrid sensor histidine kinase/response regulator n=1 Tax=Aromatoleum toluclasticum TaxID=92003 RepID=UPI0003693CC8|nr:response regulator [Aromatoleum toluclasticum]
MIADERLQDLFRQESSDYLQRLDDGLLRLERDAGEDAAVEALFRDAHSLKGAAHMLGLHAVELLAHSLEDMLNAARHDVETRGPEHVQEMLRQLGDIRGAVADALAASAGTAPARGPGAAAGAPAPASPRPPAPSPALDAVRIDARRLDTLLNASGELATGCTRIARRLADVDAIVDRCEELRRAIMNEPASAGPGALALLAPVEAMLVRLRAAMDDDHAQLQRVSGELGEGVRAIRLLPLANIFRQFPRMVQELARSQGKPVELVIEGEDVGADRRILEEIRDPLMHLLRNAVDHGIELADERARAGKPAVGRIGLRARRTESALEIVVDDDGRGLDEEAIRQAALERGLESAATLATMTPAQQRALVLRAGLTTTRHVTDVSGRGIGLDVVREAVERMKGSLALDSAPGRGLRLTLRLPVTLVTARILIVEADRCPYGLPVEHVRGSRRLAAADILLLDGRDAILFDDRPVPLVALADLIERPAARVAPDAGASACMAVILEVAAGCFAVAVEALVDEQEVVLKAPGSLLERVRNVAGATILDSGEICIVLDPPDLFASIRRRSGGTGAPAPAPQRRNRVLLAEDSITTRTQESRILEAAGYEVVTAVDGLDALRKLTRGEFDAVVTDVNMPNVDGLELARRIRCEVRHAHLPVILVTSLASDEDRMRGLEAGANAYITKPGFDQKELIECLERLI